MNELKNSVRDVTAHSEPLFASSWVALFCLLRNSLMKDGSKTDAEAKYDNAGANDTRH